LIYTYQHAGKTYTVRVEQRADGSYRAIINGTEYTFSAAQMAGGGWLLEMDGGRTVAHTAAAGENRYVHISGRAFTLSVPNERAARSRAVGAAGGLAAQMPGQVVSVLVSEGDAVEPGQALLILEAMKMEIRVSAPDAGTVRRVLVNPGDVVERGQSLIELSTPDE
jgi:3-methylcrotonyl-CoA carboxylase alpha subunit